MKLRLLRKGQYVFDIDTHTFDGEPITSGDLVLMLDRYCHDHPDDTHLRDVLSYWCYGRKPFEGTNSGEQA